MIKETEKNHKYMFRALMLQNAMRNYFAEGKFTNVDWQSVEALIKEANRITHAKHILLTKAHAAIDTYCRRGWAEQKKVSNKGAANERSKT